ncbi:MAG: DUF4145 domain-containing protein [Myxococcota bacterium]
MGVPSIKVRITCGWCETLVLVDVQATLPVRTEDEWDALRYVFGACTNCKNPLVAADDYALNSMTGEWDWSNDFRLRFPESRRMFRSPLPQLVKEAYDEAGTCERAGASIATVVMVRRALEAFVQDAAPNQNKGTKLFDGLRSLGTQGVISTEIAQWADALRFIGNQGAHPSTDRVTKQDAIDALDFLQAILETYYHFRPRFTEMQARRATAQATQAGGPKSVSPAPLAKPGE